MWVWYILIANIAVFALEYIYRKAMFSSFLEALPWVLPIVIIAQYGLFYAFRSGGAKSLIYAGTVFTLVNILLRIANSHFLLGEKVGLWQIGALVLVATASIILKFK